MSLKHILPMLLSVICTSFCAAAETARPLYSAPGADRRTELLGPDNMIVVGGIATAFRIDPFEVAEIAPGQFLPAPLQRPRSAITRDEAQQACAAGGKRLCSLAEWTSACLGLHGFRYSYGSDYVAGRCRVQADAAEDSGLSESCRNEFGIHDMVGNLMEWVADDRGGLAVAAGGSYASGQRASCFFRLHAPPELRQQELGFRCCL
ncbi:MAG: SUMF1/EgtB/PvdO family nonheme iron enzyme [Leptospirales bacterium]|nr:SUMF1/EgtB/PvdO family nonheme iron enzyme [Leptospirales bacterium]